MTPNARRRPWFALCLTAALAILLVLVTVVLPSSSAAAEEPARTHPSASPSTLPATQPVYTYRRRTFDGIGKIYHGREIAQVMGHLGAGWLERPEREQEEATRKAIDLMDFKPSDVVADIGAGTGFFSFPIAQRVAKGKVLAVDIQQEMLDLVTRKAKELGVKNVEPVLGTVSDPKLPENTVDAVLMVDAYHEFDHPFEMMTAIRRALKPGGRVILIEYRGEDPAVYIKPLHKMTEKQVRLEMEAVGLTFVANRKDLPKQHLLIFQRPAEPVTSTRPASTPAPQQ